MNNEVRVKIYRVGSRHSINLPSGLVTETVHFHLSQMKNWLHGFMENES